jgi:hypothetical protein
VIRAVLIRIAGYALSSVLASAFYIGWIIVEAGPGGLRTRAVAALIFYLSGGFAATLLLMTLPWALIVWITQKTASFRAIGFLCSGALCVLVIGCIVSSLLPKPLFVEDQTFLEGLLITLERQGILLALSGVILGFGYWFLAERNQRDDARSCTQRLESGY